MKFRAIFQKKIIIPAIIIFLIGGGVVLRARSKNDASNILTEKVQKTDLKQTVLATGQVVSQTDLALSFKGSGTISRLNVKVGDKVAAGAVLANLDQRNELAALKSAQGSLVQAEANYQKVLEGARSEEIAVAEAAVAAAEVALQNAVQDRTDTVAEQQTLTDNAQRKLLNTDTSATSITRYDTSATLTVTGTYTGSAEGEYKIKLQGTGLSNFYFQASGLETDSKPIVRGTPLALGKRGLYLTFGTSGNFSEIDEWVIRIPNVTSSSYVGNYNAYLAALETRKSALSAADAAVSSAEVTLKQKQAELALKKAQARPSDVEAARAQVLSAEGQVQAASAALENTVIRAPVAGTITSVDIKVGEQNTSLKEAIVLQDVDNLYLEANISEANIASLQLGQDVKVTFDALGPDKTYEARVSSIDPASTVISGVVNYKIKALLNKADEVKPGMSANMSILTASKPSALAIPQRAVIMKDGKKFVRVVTDSAKKTYREQEVTTGLAADQGLQEIVSGLSEGEEIVTFINKK